MRHARRLAHALCLAPLACTALLVPAGAAAQLRGVPALSPGRPNPNARLVFHAVGARAPEQSDGSGWSGALQASHGVGGRASVLAGAAVSDIADAGTRPQVMAGAAIAVLRTAPARFMPTVSLAAGAGAVLGNAHEERAVALSLPVDVIVDLHGLFLEPFIAPRVQSRRVERAGARATQSGAGVSYGMRAGLAIGAALVLAIDHSRFHEDEHHPVTRDAGTATSAALGLRLALRTSRGGGAR